MNDKNTQWHETFLKMAGTASIFTLILTVWFISLIMFFDQFQTLDLMQKATLSLILVSLGIFLIQMVHSFFIVYYNPLTATADTFFQKIVIGLSILSLVIVILISFSFSYKSIMKYYKNNDSELVNCQDKIKREIN